MAEYIPKDKVLELWWYWKFIEAYDKTAEMEGIELDDYVPKEWHDRVCEEMAKHHTADRPKGEWKLIKKTINTTLVSCSECGKRFHIPNCCFKSERDRWKCCPICCADMRGEDNE